ncbi:MAG: hypothetical protein AAF621_03945, partial [Pseudomonadota bacterium]
MGMTLSALRVFTETYRVKEIFYQKHKMTPREYYVKLLSRKQKPPPKSPQNTLVTVENSKDFRDKFEHVAELLEASKKQKTDKKNNLHFDLETGIKDQKDFDIFREKYDFSPLANWATDNPKKASDFLLTKVLLSHIEKKQQRDKILPKYLQNIDSIRTVLLA